jgi:cyclohexanone monooxygenase
LVPDFKFLILIRAGDQQNKKEKQMQAANSTTPQVKIAIIGAGFGGLAMAIRLLQNNIRDFVILEKASEIGGTWRENQYPGAACDVQSHLYSLSFSPKTDWSKRYAEAPEIYQYMQTLTTEHQLQPYIRFNTEVSAAHYLDNQCLWQLTLNQNETLTAQFVIFASANLVSCKTKMVGLSIASKLSIYV